MIDKEESLQNPLPDGMLFAGRYTILRSLGMGSMGCVYLAKDSEWDGRHVAIKALNNDFLRKNDVRQRFMREAELTRKVKHKNVVEMYDAGSDRGLLYFTMEYLDSTPLCEHMSEGLFEKSSFLSITLQICEALAAIHEAGIIHRDLKPENVLVLKDGSIRITDFGVARPEISTLTGHNEVLGSINYIAPEVWLGREITHSIDLYALGIVMYELATGMVPYEGNSPTQLIRLHVKGNPVHPRKRNRSIARWLDRLICSLLAKSPKDRPQNISEVINYLNKHASKLDRKSTLKITLLKESMILDRVKKISACLSGN